MIHSWIFMHTVIGNQVKNIPGTQASSTFLSCFPPRAISLLACRLVLLSQIGFVKIIHLKSLLIWTRKQSQTSKKKRTVDSMWRSETHKTHLLGPFINKYLFINIYLLWRLQERQAVLSLQLLRKNSLHKIVRKGKYFRGFQCVLLKSLREAGFRALSISIVLLPAVELLTYCSA